MILEELQKEIDWRSNSLVIENIARLLDSPWYDCENIDKEIMNLVNIYYTQVRKYASSKLELHRAKKTYTEDVWNDKLQLLSYNTGVLKRDKDKIRQELIKHNVNYKKYNPR